MRHRRHHAAVHEAQLAREGRRRSAENHSRSLPHRDDRAARPGGRRHSEGRAVRQGYLRRSLTSAPAAELPAAPAGRPRPDPGGRRTDGDGDEADDLFGRRGGECRPGGEPSAARTGRSHRLSDHVHPDGPRHLSRLRQELVGHARHARHLRGQHGHARLRRHAVRRRPFRRPHHRPSGRLFT